MLRRLCFLLTAFLLTAFLLTACHAEPAPPPPIPAPLPIVLDAGAPEAAPPTSPLGGTPKNEPHDTLTMERTPCMGSCPMYRISVRDDGLVVYEGMRFVRQHGRVTRHVSPELAKSLLDEYRVVSAIPRKKSKVIVMTSDMPGVNFTFEDRGGTKSTLEHDSGDSQAPQEWTTFETKVDEMLRTDSLISCGKIDCPR